MLGNFKMTNFEKITQLLKDEIMTKFQIHFDDMTATEQVRTVLEIKQRETELKQRRQMLENRF